MLGPQQVQKNTIFHIIICEDFWTQVANNPTWLDKTLNWLLIDVSSQIIKEKGMPPIRIVDSDIVLVECATEAYIIKQPHLHFCKIFLYMRGDSSGKGDF